MAFENLRRLYAQYLDLKFNNACPVVITFCDAAAESKMFSDATVDFKLEAGLPMSYFFNVGHRELMKYLLSETNDRSEAVRLLENFFANVEQHKNCLQLLREKREQDDIQVLLAAHLFGPLAGDKNVKIGNKAFPSKLRCCPNCKQNITANLGNTSLGNGRVWHGYADILVKTSVVSIPDRDESDGDEDGRNGPVQKKRRTDSSEDDLELKSVVEVKKDFSDSKATSQGLAQTIVNAFCEKKTAKLPNSFFPSFIATLKCIKISMYSCGLDRLFITRDLDIWNESELEVSLNMSTIFCVWFALNFEIFYPDAEKEMAIFKELFPEAKFKMFAGRKLPLYEDSCCKPMTSKEVSSQRNYDLNYKTLRFALPVLDEQNESLKRLGDWIKTDT